LLKKILPPDGREKMVAVEIVSFKPKPRVRSFLESLGSLVLDDPVLLAKHGDGPGGEEDEAVGVEGLRCFYCFDEVGADATYESHVRVCAQRWRRMELLKPQEERRAEPQRPTSVQRPSNVDDQGAVAKWSEAAKEAMGALDGHNPNGGGALLKLEQAEERRGAKAAHERLTMGLQFLDDTVLTQIQTLDALHHRIAWEGQGGNSQAARAMGGAYDDHSKQARDTAFAVSRLNESALEKANRLEVAALAGTVAQERSTIAANAKNGATASGPGFPQSLRPKKKEEESASASSRSSSSQVSGGGGGGGDLFSLHPAMTSERERKAAAKAAAVVLGPRKEGALLHSRAVASAAERELEARPRPVSEDIMRRGCGASTGGGGVNGGCSRAGSGGGEGSHGVSTQTKLGQQQQQKTKTKNSGSNSEPAGISRGL